MKAYTPAPEEWDAGHRQAHARLAPVIVGRDEVGLCAITPEGFRFYMTDCCHAAVTGDVAGVVCKGCFRVVDPRMGGVPE